LLLLLLLRCCVVVTLRYVVGVVYDPLLVFVTILPYVVIVIAFTLLLFTFVDCCYLLLHVCYVTRLLPRCVVVFTFYVTLRSLLIVYVTLLRIYVYSLLLLLRYVTFVDYVCCCCYVVVTLYVVCCCYLCCWYCCVCCCRCPLPTFTLPLLRCCDWVLLVVVVALRFVIPRFTFTIYTFVLTLRCCYVVVLHSVTVVVTYGGWVPHVYVTLRCCCVVVVLLRYRVVVMNLLLLLVLLPLRLRLLFVTLLY